MSPFDSSTPFILIARIQVNPGKIDEYLELATKTDAAVEASEPGMLHHTFDQDSENPLCFTWSELYQNDDAFLAHLENPSVATSVPCFEIVGGEQSALTPHSLLLLEVLSLVIFIIIGKAFFPILVLLFNKHFRVIQYMAPFLMKDGSKFCLKDFFSISGYI